MQPNDGETRDILVEMVSHPHVSGKDEKYTVSEHGWRSAFRLSTAVEAPASTSGSMELPRDDRLG